ncbi:MAG: sigma-54-dependent Fis family transcriptional regulator [Lentisphaerae bacterium]|nr:sigma-54-dependent Fis family transcriptional regulator [Lentisphaerota bacterium]MCP4103686.1 sigma-54-dependent Fis family transcriptional regulator [Lentisphaerota bacterium]
MAKILVVDDESSIIEVLSSLLTRNGYDISSASNGTIALNLLKDNAFDLLITDMRMPGMNGLELLKSAKKLQEHLAVIVMSAYAEVDEAVSAMKEGAFDYITKPFKFDELLLTVQRALSYENAMVENKLLKRSLKTKYHFDFIIGDSEPMLRVYSLIEKVAKTGSTVLVTGASGTGKELIARAIHESSARSKHPFIKVNCAAMPDNLLESELFGYVKGAFTGASNDRKGLFEAADGGTIFLDEIGSIPFNTQAKMLRVLQEKEIRRVGGTESVKVDVRIVAATNEDLRRKTSLGDFREDLYFRLSVIPVVLPPLRERREDIPALVEHFLKRFADENHRKVTISAGALELFCEYSWPGNIRQLENLVSRVATLNETSEIVVDELPQELLTRSSQESVPAAAIPIHGDFDTIIPLKKYLRKVERAYLGKVLDRCDGDKNLAARNLGISLASLYRKYEE